MRPYVFSRKSFFENFTSREIPFSGPMINPIVLLFADNNDVVDVNNDAKMSPAKKDTLAKQLFNNKNKNNKNKNK